MADYSKQIKDIIANLSAEESLRGLFQQHLEGNPLPSARGIHEIVKLSRAIIFPGYFGSSKINRHTVGYHIGVQVESLFEVLTEQISAALCFQSADNDNHVRATASSEKNPLLKLAEARSGNVHEQVKATEEITSCGTYASCAVSGSATCASGTKVNDAIDHALNNPNLTVSEGMAINADCKSGHEQGMQCLTCDDEVKEYAKDLAAQYIASLADIRTKLAMDVKAAFDSDPAATSFGEVICCYPGVRAIFNHRIAHKLLTLGVPLIPRAISELAHSETGIDIHPGARIGDSFAIDHGTGVVVGETCIIGKNVKLYQGVTLGAKTIPVDSQGVPLNIPRHPIVEDDVVIYSNATILGRITIGKGAIIGGNVWVTQDVPQGGKVVQAISHNSHHSSHS